MILYLDTSALVKLYVEEPGSHAVANALAEATNASTARIKYAEARASVSHRSTTVSITLPDGSGFPSGDAERSARGYGMARGGRKSTGR